MVEETDNLFKSIYEAFARESTPTLMLRILTERAFSAAEIDALFRRTAVQQYEREILFSTAVELMVLVVTGARTSVHRAWQRDKDRVGTSIKALYDKLAGVEPGVDQALVRHTAARCGELVQAMDATRSRRVGPFPLRIVDGMHIEASERRLKVLRDVAAGPRPGFALAVFDAETELVTDALFECDAHAQERSRTDDLLALARSGECWMGDRNFCTIRYVIGLLAQGSHPLLRQHGHFPFEARGARRHAGRTDAGKVFKQPIRIWTEDGTAHWDVWRITLELDTPTRDGDTAIHLITDLLDHGVEAVTCVLAYGGRWTIEGCFLEMATALNAEINALGYPPAALFGLAIGFCSYNVLSTLRAALRAAHGAAPIDAGLSTFAVVEEARGAWRGLTILIAAEIWARYHTMPAGELATELRALARRLSLDDGYRKSKRGPKKPRTPRTRFKRKPHVATQRLLDANAAR
jgi:hypothetical protein